MLTSTQYLVEQALEHGARGVTEVCRKVSRWARVEGGRREVERVTKDVLNKRMQAIKRERDAERAKNLLAAVPLEELLISAECLSEMVAEDASEAAMYGDGPFGSEQRQHELQQHEAEISKRLCKQANALHKLAPCIGIDDGVEADILF